MAGSVFHDPSGRRGRRAGLALGLVLATIAAVGAGFAATLALAPKLPNLPLKDPYVRSALHVETQTRGKLRRLPWTRVPRPEMLGAAASGAQRPLTLAFYVSGDPNSRQSLIEHIAKIDVLSPQWVTLNGSSGAISVQDDKQANVVLRAAKKPPSVLPSIANLRDGEWDGRAAANVILNSVARKALIANLADQAQKRGFAGYIFDLENLPDRAVKAYPTFLAEARAALKPIGREVWTTAPFDDRTWDLTALQASTDTVVLMAYDEHWLTSTPGSPASQGWYQENLADTLGKMDPQRTIVALGSYGYDWTKRGGKWDTAEAQSFHESTVIAADSSVDIDFDSDALTPHFDYQDHEDGLSHQLWFLDAVTMFNQMKVTDPFRPRGYGLWRLGDEDPGVWTLLGRDSYGKLDDGALQAIAGSNEVEFDGTGEVLKVTETPKPGKRTMTIDRGTGLISDENYDVIPSGYIVSRYGAHPGLIALTFDDGPNPKYTKEILDILKEKHAPATFFVIGQNMQNWPGLVKREVAEGHIVGSHTFTHPNIAAIPTWLVDGELNSTQRLFEVWTGRSMRFFRPPYFGDAEPSTPAEVIPLLKAQALGYLTVGLRIDTDDWCPNRGAPPANGPCAGYLTTAPGIIDKVVSRLSDTDPETAGQVVLMHDSGGDRSMTVKALPGLIDALRAKGYRLVTVAELAGMSPAQAMPASGRNPVALTLDRVGFGFVHGVELSMTTLFVTAIALGLARLAFLGTLALWHRFTSPPPATIDPATGPLVTVLIPCFNEEKVIVSSTNRILKSDWTNIEVLVLDDGSTDNTSAVVQAAYRDEPRVRLLRFDNGGKAAALNRGLKEARGAIVVALDADTLFAKDTIGLLARWFENPDIGAVAGNALVGNRLNVVTRWQALEYVTAQNLERRALDALGAVTVVPGAVGAWRREALEALGGYPGDTLAEDQDLTIAVQRAGWMVDFDPDARAYTEAPDSIRGLLKQRFRWSFGTLQCMWKHRSALFDPGRPVLGFFALPQIWLFQVVLTVAAPLVDLGAIWSIVSAIMTHYSHPVEWSADDLVRTIFYWCAFVLVDLSAAILGLALEKRAPWKELIWLPVQRFGYRQMMYYVVVKAVITAIRGPRVGWGKLERRNTAAVEGAA
ncbi:MAG TPA: glycosyltransferase [Caulobacteraceae bacterium]|jgi:cellulose synthase/poly-beta-1,6-N-acetylglucosamine synthase-like glycosyltransferase/spore germination protein YaaH/peptidoglycan/xylan/chitin deacetylase (PgdA/CDA1 family)